MAAVEIDGMFSFVISFPWFVRESLTWFALFIDAGSSLRYLPLLGDFRVDGCIVPQDGTFVNVWVRYVIPR
jgi:hypothetical protein